ncbi:hypothetical protein [Nonomuraea polychroma]|uniref:hypothetical protein n=1 Tax=Nonomuraea polychroma TaxID=46176 RepID=UPI000FDE318F|nr:hypothetical protein [Nonomuraea polychroma]
MLGIGLAAFMLATGVAAATPVSAAASPPYFLYWKWKGQTCTKGAKTRTYNLAISRRKYDTVFVKNVKPTPDRMISYSRERSFIVAHVEEFCTKRYSTGSKQWQWQSVLYGAESGKVSRLIKSTALCHSGGCYPPGPKTYGAWRAGWTHFKM